MSLSTECEEEVTDARKMFWLYGSMQAILFMGIFFLAVAGPAIFALTTPVLGGMMLRCGQNMLALDKEDKAAKAIEPKTEFHCETYETTKLEMNLAEGGIITKDEITLCEDKTCPLCKPERDRRQRAREDVNDRALRQLETRSYEQRKRDWIERRNYEKYVQQYTPRYGYCKRCGAKDRIWAGMCDWCTKVLEHNKRNKKRLNAKDYVPRIGTQSVWK